MGIYDFLEFRHLASIVGIAEYGTFTAAAPHHQHRTIRAGVARFGSWKINCTSRFSSRAAPHWTPAGESLLAYAKRALPEREDVVNAAVAIHQATLQPFRLGFSPFVTNAYWVL